MVQGLGFNGRGRGERSGGKGSSPLEAAHRAQFQRRASELVVGCVLEDVIAEAWRVLYFRRKWRQVEVRGRHRPQRAHGRARSNTCQRVKKLIRASILVPTMEPVAVRSSSCLSGILENAQDANRNGEVAVLHSDPWT